MPQFEEKQNFEWWAYACVFGGEGAALVGIIAASQEEPAALWTLPVIILSGLWLWSVLHAITRVHDTEVYFQLGAPIPFIWKRFPLNEIQNLRVVDYRPLRDAGGWGMRWGKFEGERCTYFNAKGTRGVSFTMNEHNYIIGSQKSEELLAAIANAQARLA